MCLCMQDYKSPRFRFATPQLTDTQIDTSRDAKTDKSVLSGEVLKANPVGLRISFLILTSKCATSHLFRNKFFNLYFVADQFDY